MAGIAIYAVVHVAAHIFVTEIVGIVAAMAAGALESRISCLRARMAGCAHPACVAVIDREKAVGEFRAQPIRCRVAGRASCRGDARSRSIRSYVIRHESTKSQRAVPIPGVAAIAIRRWHGGRDMAQVASRRDMRTGQCESCRGVVKNRIQPICRRVAGPARLRVPQRDVVRNQSTQCCCALPF